VSSEDQPEAAQLARELIAIPSQPEPDNADDHSQHYVVIDIPSFFQWSDMARSKRFVLPISFSVLTISFIFLGLATRQMITKVLFLLCAAGSLLGAVGLVYDQWNVAYVRSRTRYTISCVLAGAVSGQRSGMAGPN